MRTPPIGRLAVGLGFAIAIVLLLVSAARANVAPVRCSPPAGGEWKRVTPQQAGMDAQKLQAAMDYGTENLSFAVRVFRRGCLVMADRFEALNDWPRYESWSLGKSVTSLLFGAAMTDGEISPDDPLGSLLPEADAAHGEIDLRDLLTMTSGLEWNGLRDYNVFTQRDRVRDALTLRPVREPGAYYEYAQSAVALVAKAVERATGHDPRRYLQGKILDPLGIDGSDWHWMRDGEGNIEGFRGVHMRPNDFGRLGELMRRGGRWRGERLLSKEYVRSAVTPSAKNGCYGWLIWLAAKSETPCVGPRIGDRPVTRDSGYPGMPRDMFVFSGLFGQLVAVFPSEEIVLVRTGFDSALVNPTGGKGWQHGLYSRVLDAVTDQRVRFSKEFTGEDLPNEDGGFAQALLEPDRYRQGLILDPLPPAGPARARAVQVRSKRVRVTRRGRLTVKVRCPQRWPASGPGRCRGRAKLRGARHSRRYSIGAGKNRKLRFRLKPRAMGRPGSGRARISLRNRDAAGGVRTTALVRLR